MQKHPGRKNPKHFLRPIQNDRLARSILTFVREALPERWHEVYAAVMPGCTQGTCTAFTGAGTETWNGLGYCK